VINPLRPIQEEIDNAITDKMIPKINALGGMARRLYFYFAGHGLGSMDNISDTALCLANWSELNRNKALSSEAYKEVIRQFGYFEEIIFLADCCMHPSFAPPMPIAKDTQLFIGYATQYQDESFEIEVGTSEMRGVFTKVLIEGLNGAAANSDGVVNADSLKDYLYIQTPIEAQKAGFKQKPEIFSSFTSATPILTLANFQNADTKCIIIFSNSRTTVDLIGNSGLISTFDASQKNQVEVLLPKGLYLLQDKSTGENYPIQVSPSNEPINVNF
jgi:hypothetical protein